MGCWVCLLPNTGEGRKGMLNKLLTLLVLILEVIKHLADLLG